MDRVLHTYEMHLITADNQAEFWEYDEAKGDKWGVRKKDGGHWVTIGFITSDYDFRVTFADPLPGSLLLVAMSSFVGRAAYAAVNGDTSPREIIAVSIPEVPGQWGLLGSGWPPREV